MEYLTERTKVDSATITKCISEFVQELGVQLQCKGDLGFISSHETLGVITEEYYELCEAVHENNEKRIVNELMDVVIAAFFGYATLIQNEKNEMEKNTNDN